jgi:hypothetical protein
MKILTDYESLEGKTIAFCHMAQFADQITIATTDGEVLMVTMEDYDGDKEINILHEGEVMRELGFSAYLRNELGKRGIFDLDAYKTQKEKEAEENRKKWEEKKRKDELEMLEKLKEKYENS